MTREAQPKEYLAKYTADRVRTLGMAWLGSTFACCECHDHKFDPIKTKDFYSMGAFFADLKQWGVYQTYDYTPNPDLPGWSNDHPWPPEIFVTSLTLERRIEKLKAEAVSLVAKAAAKDASSSAWLATTRAFLAGNPSGWETPEVLGVTAEATVARRQASRRTAAASAKDSGTKDAGSKEEAAVVGKDGRIEFIARPNTSTCRFGPARQPGCRSGGTAPQQQNRDKITRRQAATIRTALFIHRANGKTESTRAASPLPIISAALLERF